MWYKIGVLFFITTAIQAETITVHNKSEDAVWVAIYYVPSSQNKIIDRATSVVKIDALGSVQIQKPDRKKEGYFNYYDRDLVFSPRSEILESKLSWQDYKRLLWINVGTLKSIAASVAQVATGPFPVYQMITAQAPAVYFVKKDNRALVLDQARWNVFQQIEAAQDVIWGLKAIRGFVGVYKLSGSSQELNKIRQSNKAFTQDPYRNQKARVREGNALTPQESTATTARLAVVHSALEKFLERKIKKVPRIALVGSGGGYRALLSTLGFLTGAQEIGLLDASLWCSSLSGSAWALAVIYMNQAKSGQRINIGGIRDTVISMIANKDLYKPISDHEFTLLFNYLLVRAASDLPFSAVVLWGALLTNRLFANFGDERHNLHLWQMEPVAQAGVLPLPIFTAVQGDPGIDRVKREWFEFTPWQVGSPWLGAYVPSWAYGRGFNNGESDERLGESLGFNIGTFGSAISVSIADAIQELEKGLASMESGVKKTGLGGIKLLLDAFAKLPSATLAPVMGSKAYSTVTGAQVADVRVLGAVIHNFMYGMQSAKIKGPYMQLIDAGIAFNLPYPPISGERPERKADIIIFLDASADIKEVRYGSLFIENQLRLVAEYARWKKLSFPKIDFMGIDKKVVSVFKDTTDSTAPVVIYLPRVNIKPNEKDSHVLSFWNRLSEPEFAKYNDIKNFDLEECNVSGDCNTFNFKYTKENARLLSMTTEFNMRAAKETIRKVIDEWVTAQERSK
jgi:phospholipase A2